MEFEPGTALSEITELPTSHEALDDFSWLKRLFVSGMLVSSSLRCASFATSMFEIRKSKFVVFQYVNKRISVCLLPGNCFVVHGDVSRRMICWKKTFTNSLVEAKASENVRENFAFASEQNRTIIYGGKSKYITKLGTRNFRVLHLAYNTCGHGLRPRVVCSVCKTRH